jgi:hypothetical protein
LLGRQRNRSQAEQCYRVLNEMVDGIEGEYGGQAPLDPRKGLVSDAAVESEREVGEPDR